jgi:hypothetical protein
MLNSVPHSEMDDMVLKLLVWIGNDDGDDSEEDGMLESVGNHSPSDDNGEAEITLKPKRSCETLDCGEFSCVL